jgi:hypothetical protein
MGRHTRAGIHPSPLERQASRWLTLTPFVSLFVRPTNIRQSLGGRQGRLDVIHKRGERRLALLGIQTLLRWGTHFAVGTEWFISHDFEHNQKHSAWISIYGSGDMFSMDFPQSSVVCIDTVFRYILVGTLALHTCALSSASTVKGAAPATCAIRCTKQPARGYSGDSSSVTLTVDSGPAAAAEEEEEEVEEEEEEESEAEAKDGWRTASVTVSRRGSVACGATRRLVGARGFRVFATRHFNRHMHVHGTWSAQSRRKQYSKF